MNNKNKISGLRKVGTILFITMLYGITQIAVAANPFKLPLFFYPNNTVPNKNDAIDALNAHLQNEIQKATGTTIPVNIKNPINKDICLPTYGTVANLIKAATIVLNSFPSFATHEYMKHYYKECALALADRNGMTCDLQYPNSGLKVVNKTNSLQPNEINVDDAYLWSRIVAAYAVESGDVWVLKCINMDSYDKALETDKKCKEITAKIRLHNSQAGAKDCLEIDDDLFAACTDTD